MVPDPRQGMGVESGRSAPAGSRHRKRAAPPAAAPVRMSWARLLKRVFEIDLEHCPQCGGLLKIIAAIEAPPIIAQILTHLGLPARAPPRSPTGSFDRFQMA